MCWASPRDSHDKIFVMYIERNPDNTMLTRGYIAPLGLSAVRNYGVLMELDYVVIEDPNPDARAAYQREHFTQLPGIGLAYDLTQDYDGDNPEVAQDDH